MAMKSIMFSALTVAAVVATALADDYNEFLKSAKADYSDFQTKAAKEYQEYRSQINRQYADYLSEIEWKPYAIDQAVPRPKQKDKELPPVVIPDGEKNHDDYLESKPVEIKIDSVIKNKPVVYKQPKPIVPIVLPELHPDEVKPSTDPLVAVKPVPKGEIARPQRPDPVVKPGDKPIIVPDQPRPEVADELPALAFSLYGTEFKVTLLPEAEIGDVAANEKAIGAMWGQMAQNQAIDRVIVDMLALRDKHKLCDWAYLGLINAFVEQLYGSRNNSARMMAAYIYAQSGYSMRLAYGRESGKIYMLVGSDNFIYDNPSFLIDKRYFYPFEPVERSLCIVAQEFPKSTPLSLDIPYDQKFAVDATPQRSVTVKHYPDIQLNLVANRNLMDFFESYPVSAINNDGTSKWLFYANTPLSDDVKAELYPRLRSAIEGKTQQEAANILIDFVQSFPYGYDDEIWGHDRAFFADETLFYPKGDCEDHAILFTRLVRDLMGLPCALLYYPGHLASAVAFDEEFNGSALSYNGKRYTVCDATIFYAPCGRTMKGMSNLQATLIPLAD